MIGKYDAKWVEHFYDEYGQKEWERLTKDPTNEVKLHVHRHYLEKYVQDGHSVLEIGPGPGRFTQIMAQLGARIVLVDISSGQLELNRQKAAELGFEHAVEKRLKLDMCDMRILDNEAFDVVVCYGGPLSYVFEKREKAVGEILRVLRPGGVALVSVMSLWGVVHEFLSGVLALPSEINRSIVHTGDLCLENFPENTHHCHMFNAGELRTLLESCGAVVLEMSASNCLSAARGDRLTETRQDAAKWEQLLEMELEACREPGCVDMGTHMIAVIRKEE